MTQTNEVTLSDAAAIRIADILASEQGKTALRVSVEGGGCSGFQYGFSFDESQEEDDTVIERDGVKLLVDSMS